MASNWTTYKIGDLFDLQNGFAFKGTDFINEGVPVIKIKNVKAGKILLNDLSYVSREVADKAKRFFIKPNDILITMSGNRMDGSPETWVGKVALFLEEDEYLLNQRVGILRPKYGVDVNVDFCAYALSSREYQNYFINSANSSGGQANISPSIINETEIDLPDKATQDEIASVLRAIDDKIENHEEINFHLETLIQAIFNEWFIQSKTASNTEQYKDSELGSIPATWNIKSLEEVTEIITKGTTPTTLGGSFVSDGIKFLRAESILDSSVIDTTKPLYISDDVNSKMKRSILKLNDILITIAGTIGRVGMVNNFNLPANINQAVAIIRVAPDIVSHYFIYCLMRRKETKDNLLGKVTQSVQANISLTDLRNFTFILPDKFSLENFNETVSPQFDLIVNNTLEINILTGLKSDLVNSLIVRKEIMLNGA